LPKYINKYKYLFDGAGISIFSFTDEPEENGIYLMRRQSIGIA